MLPRLLQHCTKGSTLRPKCPGWDSSNTLYFADLSALPTRQPVIHADEVPEISRFFGIVIAIYYRDHAPPHFHALYGEHEAIVIIESGFVTGNLPRRVRALVEEWRVLRKAELISAWDRAQAGQRLTRIAPLE